MNYADKVLGDFNKLLRGILWWDYRNDTETNLRDELSDNQMFEINVFIKQSIITLQGQHQKELKEALKKKEEETEQYKDLLRGFYKLCREMLLVIPDDVFLKEIDKKD